MGLRRCEVVTDEDYRNTGNEIARKSQENLQAIAKQRATGQIGNQNSVKTGKKLGDFIR